MKSDNNSNSKSNGKSDSKSSTNSNSNSNINSNSRRKRNPINCKNDESNRIGNDGASNVNGSSSSGNGCGSSGDSGPGDSARRGDGGRGGDSGRSSGDSGRGERKEERRAGRSAAAVAPFSGRTRNRTRGYDAVRMGGYVCNRKRDVWTGVAVAAAAAAGEGTRYPEIGAESRAVTVKGSTGTALGGSPKKKAEGGACSENGDVWTGAAAVEPGGQSTEIASESSGVAGNSPEMTVKRFGDRTARESSERHTVQAKGFPFFLAAVSPEIPTVVASSLSSEAMPGDDRFKKHSNRNRSWRRGVRRDRGNGGDGKTATSCDGSGGAGDGGVRGGGGGASAGQLPTTRKGEEQPPTNRKGEEQLPTDRKGEDQLSTNRKAEEQLPTDEKAEEQVPTNWKGEQNCDGVGSGGSARGGDDGGCFDAVSLKQVELRQAAGSLADNE